LQSSTTRIFPDACVANEQGILKIFYADLYDDAEEDEGSYIFYFSLIPQGERNVENAH
jgi:hypothetical protein